MHDKQDGGFSAELHSGRHLTRSTSTREPALDFAQRPPQLDILLMRVSVQALRLTSARDL
jgi:hypothetical protein